MGDGAYLKGYSSVGRCIGCLKEPRGTERCWCGKLGVVACSMVLEGIKEASKRKYKWDCWQTGHLL